MSMPMTPRPNPRNAQRAADRFNEEHPVGTPVLLTLDSGEEIKTHTRSAAWVVGGHSAMVMVIGKSGGWQINRVRRREAA